MRLYSTTKGIARQSGQDKVDLMEINSPDLGALLSQDPELNSLKQANVVETIALSEVSLLAPVPRPGTVYCIGANYEGHIEEVKSVLETMGNPTTVLATLESLRKTPMFFTVPSSAVIGASQEIVLPRLAPDQVDYEIEIAVVVGIGGKDVSEEEAWSKISGITLANDVSARDIQGQAMRGTEFEFGHAKGMDTFKPMGPCLVTTDELTLPLNFSIQTTVNGELRQSANINELIHNIPRCFAYISKFHTLYPGDVILTGSPAGVGFFQGKFLKAGDTLVLSAEGIGKLQNTIISE